MKNQTNHISQHQAIVTFLILCLCYMIPNYAQYQISPLGVQIIEQYGLQLSHLSSLFSAPMIPAIFFSLAGGLLLDRFGSKAVIGIGLILTTAGCLWRIVCGSYIPLFAATLLTGFTACFINAGSGKMVGGLFKAQEVPGKMGILMAASTGAMTIANFTSAYFPSIRSAFITSAAFAVVGTVLWFLLVKGPKQNASQNEAAEPAIRECLKIAVKNYDIWKIAFALFFIMAANVVVGSFLPTALSTHNISAAVSGAIAACYTIGNLLGCLVAPLFISKLHSQKKVLLLFAILAGIGIAFSWLVPVIPLLAIAVLLTGIFLGGMIPTLMTIPVQIPEIGPKYAGTAGGVIGTIQLLGAVLLPSYILTPLAGNNFTILFILGGACIWIAGVLSGCIRKIS